jgi:hypothetical protein
MWKLPSSPSPVKQILTISNGSGLIYRKAKFSFLRRCHDLDKLHLTYPQYLVMVLLWSVTVRPSANWERGSLSGVQHRLPHHKSMMRA